MSSHAAHKLSALFVKKTNKPGKYSDGLGLYLIVEPTGSKRWEQRLTIKGKRCDLGLGSTKLVTLEEARLVAHLSKKLRIKNLKNPSHPNGSHWLAL